MPNPYHDAEGRFCSREEMVTVLQTAADNGDLDTFSGYVRIWNSLIRVT